MRVERLPFTVYDIVGYLIPGITGLWCLLYVFEYFGILGDTKDVVMLGSGDFSVALAVLLFFVFAYLTGHVIGFLSSVTVERLSIAFYGYPSAYICNEYCEKEKIGKWSIEKNKKKFSKKHAWYFPVIFIFLFPIAIFLTVINKTKFYYLWIKSLPPSIIEMMMLNFEQKTESAGLVLKKINFEESDDWFRFVCFYTFNNYQNAAYRLYNYLTIYGFIRNMCLIFNFATWFFILSSILSSIELSFPKESTIQIHFAWPEISATVICAMLTIILFLTFLKFYRRYTEEAILAFATHDDKLATG